MKAYGVLVASLAVFGLTACASLPNTPSLPNLGKILPTSTQNTTAQAGEAAAPTVSTSENINAVVNAFVVRQAGGSETLEPVTANTAIKSGDVIEYHGLFTNTGKDRVRQMTVTLALPQGAAFTGVTEPALGVKASLDNSRFVFMPIRVSNNGAVENVPFAQYKALRWTIEEIGIGATAVVKYRATIQ